MVLKSDEELIDEFRLGDKLGFEAIYDRYADAIYRYLYYMLGDSAGAKDVMQDVFVKVYCKASLYKPLGKFSSWLYKVAKNTALNSIRRNRDLHAGTSIDMSLENSDVMQKINREHTTPGSEAYNCVITKEEKVLMQKGLLKLSVRDRQILILCDINEVPYEEVAKILGCSRGNLRVKLHRARLRLADIVNIKEEFFSEK